MSGTIGLEFERVMRRSDLAAGQELSSAGVGCRMGIRA
jgi:hypothetical protein